VSPWLITTTAWPAAAVLVSAMVRVVDDPATPGVTTAILVLAGAGLPLRVRARLRREGGSAS
jgi:hypothetical protein